jgi:hypothetical protein
MHVGSVSLAEYGSYMHTLPSAQTLSSRVDKHSVSAIDGAQNPVAADSGLHWKPWPQGFDAVLISHIVRHTCWFSPALPAQTKPSLQGAL